MPAAKSLSGSRPRAADATVLTLSPGTEITANERRYRIQFIRDLDSVVAQDIETGICTRVADPRNLATQPFQCAGRSRSWQHP